MHIVSKLLVGISSVLVLGLSAMRCYETIHLQRYESMQPGIDTVYAYDTYNDHVRSLQMFTTNDQQSLYYLDQAPEDESDAPVLLLVHGTPTNSRLYRKMITPLVDAGWRVIVPDMIGYGMSDKPTDLSEYTVSRQSDRLHQLMQSLQIDQYTIAGHDQGSLRVREHVANYPDSIKQLIVFNSIAHRDGFHPPAGFGSPNLMTRGLSTAMGLGPTARIMAYGSLAGGLDDTSVVTTDMIDGYLRPLMDGTSRAYYQFISSFDQIQTQMESNIATISELDIPTTIIRGQNDKILIAEDQVPVLKELRELNDTDVHIIDANHFIMEEASDEIVEIVGGLL